ncbi:MAG: OmpA family protein [Elusimicrobia bacterium]|nr:OmpA family protein [Elusimicrobiota bacterium]
MDNIFMNKKFILFFMCLLTTTIFFGEENYSRQMKQAITLYQEGKNTDAMDRFMDILVQGTPEEKALANEYISKITTGISPESNKNANSVSVKTVDSSANTPQIVQPAATTKSVTNDSVTLNNEKGVSNSVSYANSDDMLADKVSAKLKEIKSNILLSLYKENFAKLYMDDNNEKPLYILLKNDVIFNTDLTFNTKIINKMKLISGLLVSLGNVSVTVVPNGAVVGNMKILDVRKASVLHSYFMSSGLSPTKVKLDMLASNISISKKIDDLDGTLLILNYDKQPDTFSPDLSSPGAYVSIYPDNINISKDEAAIIEFSVIMGKNPIGSWKLLVNKLDRNGQSFSIQKIEGTEPTSSQILFNGREKFIGNYYDVGTYEFYLEVSDTKGNTSFAKKTIYIGGNKNTDLNKKTDSDNSSNSSAKISSKTLSSKNTAKNVKASKKLPLASKVFYKVYFDSETFKITENSKIRLKQFISDYKKYPRSKIVLVGYSSSNESKPKTTALKRANVVKNFLVKNYKINKNNILVYSKVADFNKTIVEVRLK